MTHPRSLGRYQILDLIGEGGMGALYRARDPKIGRYVAIKLLRSAYDSDEIRDRFAQEARAAGCLSHPNIVTIYDVGEHEGQPFIAMEYVRGDTFADLVRRVPPLPLGRTLQLAEEVCAGLAHAHGAGIVHRDIKPANLIVSAEGVVKILDFGIAKLVDSGLTQPGTLLGTLTYMAPEQVKGLPVDARADIYSLGAVLYELVAHEPAFPGATYGEVVGRVLNGEPRDIRSVVPGLDHRLVQVIGTALERDPDRRYQDVRHMQRALAAIRLHVADDETGAGSGAGPRGPHSAAGRTTRPTPPPEDSAVRLRAEIERELRAAEEAFAARRYDAARASCKQVLLLDPADERVIHLIARVNDAVDEQRIQEQIAEARKQLAAGSVTAALRLVEDAALLSPSHPAVESMRAAIAAEEERARAAAAEASVMQARTHYRRNDLDAAAREVRRALALIPDHDDALAFREAVDAAIERRDADKRLRASVDDARRRFASGQHEAAISMLDALAEPEHPAIAAARAEIERALAEIEERRRAEEERAERRRRVKALVDEARAALAAGGLEDARRLGEEARALDHEAPEVRPLLEDVRQAAARAAKEAQLVDLLGAARAALEAGDLEGALERLRAAGAVDREDPRVISGLRDHEAAVLRKAEEARARECEALLDEAARHLEAGALEDAGEALGRATALVPGDARIAGIGGRLQEALAMREAEREAERRRQQVEAHVRTAAGRAAAAAGNPAELVAALREVKQALAIDPEHPEAGALRTSIEAELDSRRDEERARTTIANARRRFANGKHHAALRLLEEAQAPNRPEIAEALKELREALDAIEAERRAERERAERAARVATLLADARAALGADSLDEASKLIADALEIEPASEEAAALDAEVARAREDAARRAEAANAPEPAGPDHSPVGPEPEVPSAATLERPTEPAPETPAPVDARPATTEVAPDIVTHEPDLVPDAVAALPAVPPAASGGPPPVAVRESARIEAGIRNARSRFANGKHQSALRLLETLDPATHPEVAEVLEELRQALVRQRSDPTGPPPPDAPPAAATGTPAPGVGASARGDESAATVFALPRVEAGRPAVIAGAAPALSPPAPSARATEAPPLEESGEHTVFLPSSPAVSAAREDDARGRLTLAAIAVVAFVVLVIVLLLAR